MSYLSALKNLKRGPQATDKTDESPLLSVLAVPHGPHSENFAFLSAAEKRELTAMVTACVNPEEVETLLAAAIEHGHPSLAIYREIIAVNEWEAGQRLKAAYKAKAVEVWH